MRDKALKFTSVADMRRGVTASGSYWFSPGAMQCFGTVIRGLRGGRFLITEERNSPYDHKFRVMYFRQVDGQERLDDVTVGWYVTLEDARTAAIGMTLGDL